MKLPWSYRSAEDYIAVSRHLRLAEDVSQGYSHLQELAQGLGIGGSRHWFETTERIKGARHRLGAHALGYVTEGVIDARHVARIVIGEGRFMYVVPDLAEHDMPSPLHVAAVGVHEYLHGFNVEVDNLLSRRERDMTPINRRD